jgi:hypothetical protein
MELASGLKYNSVSILLQCLSDHFLFESCCFLCLVIYHPVKISHTTYGLYVFQYVEFLAFRVVCI